MKNSYARNSHALRVALKYVLKKVFRIDSQGRIWRDAVIRNTGRIVPILSKRAEFKMKTGHLGISVWRKNKQYVAYAHRLVWIVLVGKIPSRIDINHKNGIKDDNRQRNLELATRSENHIHAYSLGLRTPAGCCTPNNRNNQNGVTQAKIARLAKVHPALVSMVLNNVKGPSEKTSNHILKTARKLGYRF